jgi:hypothetical protein
VEVSRIITEIDAQIAKLQQARELLSGSLPRTQRGPGRPKGSKSAAPAAPSSSGGRKRKLTPEGRKKIADAMKRRWAERRKQTPGTSK